MSDWTELFIKNIPNHLVEFLSERTQMHEQSESKEKVRSCGVIPVLVIEEIEHAVPVTKALVAGGIDVIEVTLRTPCALEAIQEIKLSGIDCYVGAGTIATLMDIENARHAGAEFLVTPATPRTLIPGLIEFPGLVVPGVSTPTEALTLYQEGFDTLKLFPAGASGGASLLKALYSPMPNISFMPTGGVSLSNLADYLSLPNVIAAGGSWLCPADVLKAKDWDKVTDLARQANEAVKSIRKA